MKDLTKEELECLIRESNKELLSEIGMGYADELSQARPETLASYDFFITQAIAQLQALVTKAEGDYRAKAIIDADIDYIIDDQLYKRLSDAMGFCESSLRAIQGPGIKPPNTSPADLGFNDE
jgi:hypothetical protein